MRRLRFVLPTLTAALLLGGCNPRTNDDSSAVSINGAFGTSDTQGISGIFVDVVNDDATTSDTITTVHIQSDVKNTSSEPGVFYRVNIQGITIRFSRLDGHNVPGVDVPFPISYALSGTIEPGGNADLEIILATQEMKVQAPLRNLWFGEGQRIFATATATVFGVDRWQPGADDILHGRHLR